MGMRHKNIIEWLNSSLVHIYAAIHINKVDFNIEKMIFISKRMIRT